MVRQGCHGGYLLVFLVCDVFYMYTSFTGISRDMAFGWSPVQGVYIQASGMLSHPWGKGTGSDCFTVKGWLSGYSGSDSDYADGS